MKNSAEGFLNTATTATTITEQQATATIVNSAEFGKVTLWSEPDGSTTYRAGDVTAALGYRDSTNAVKQHCRGVAIYHPIVDAMGRTQPARFLVEGDVARLITHSRLESARRFESWLFDEVVPAVMRTGAYVARTDWDTDADIMARGLLAAQRQIERKDIVISELTAKNSELSSKVWDIERMTRAAGSMTITEAMRVVRSINPNVRRRDGFDALRSHRYIEQRGNGPTQAGIDAGIVLPKVTMRKSEEGNSDVLNRQYAVVTGKGLAWLLSIFCQPTTPMLEGAC